MSKCAWCVSSIFYVSLINQTRCAQVLMFASELIVSSVFRPLELPNSIYSTRSFHYRSQSHFDEWSHGSYDGNCSNNTKGESYLPTHACITRNNHRSHGCIRCNSLYYSSMLSPARCLNFGIRSFFHLQLIGFAISEYSISTTEVLVKRKHTRECGAWKRFVETKKEEVHEYYLFTT